jgi:hypothetical protein
LFSSLSKILDANTSALEIDPSRWSPLSISDIKPNKVSSSSNSALKMTRSAAEPVGLSLASMAITMSFNVWICSSPLPPSSRLRLLPLLLYLNDQSPFAHTSALLLSRTVGNPPPTRQLYELLENQLRLLSRKPGVQAFP